MQKPAITDFYLQLLACCGSRHFPRNIFSCSSQVSGRLLVSLVSVSIGLSWSLMTAPDDGRRHRRQPDEACHVALVLAKPLRQLHHSDRECPVKSNPLHGACHFRANYLKPGDLRLFIPRRSLGSLEKAKTSQKAEDFTQVLNSFLCLSGLESNPLSRP